MRANQKADLVNTNTFCTLQLFLIVSYLFYCTNFSTLIPLYLFCPILPQTCYISFYYH